MSNLFWCMRNFYKYSHNIIMQLLGVEIKELDNLASPVREIKKANTPLGAEISLIKKNGSIVKERVV